VKNLENPFVLVVDIPSSSKLTMSPFMSLVDEFCLVVLRVESLATIEEVGDVENGHRVKNITISYRMSVEFVPVKLMKNGPTKQKLLIAMHEEKTPYIEKKDWLESRINTNIRARKLMTIENASEIAKWFLQKDGIFEKIGKDIKKETGKRFVFKCRKTKFMSRKINPSKGKDYILLEHTFSNEEGHYGMVVVDHNRRSVNLYDSMRSNEEVFQTPLRSAYSTPFNLSVNNTHTQPTGGFLPTLKDYVGTRIPVKKRKSAKNIAQFDELSQHHFCYVESFVAMMKDLDLTNGGPRDPRLRLPWIKKVIWGLILKNLPLTQRTGPEWNYLNKYFKYYMKTRDSKNNLLELVNEQYQMPPNNNIVKYDIEKINLTTDITPKWTYAQIMRWADGTPPTARRRSS
jgi:hypothetical protein